MHINSVLIADDHGLILTGIRQILTENFTVGEAVLSCEPEEVMQLIDERTFDLYILDIEFGTVSGFELIDQILKKDSGARIIICTMHEEIWYLNRLLVSGARGVLLKRSSLENLGEAIRMVMEGEVYYCPRFRSIKGDTGGKNGAYQLTPTERIVLKHIVDGRKSREIASLMFVTEDAIEAHRKNLLLKLGARNVAQLVAIAICKNLLN